jgi:hypothetical protein
LTGLKSTHVNTIREAEMEAKALSKLGIALGICAALPAAAAIDSGEHVLRAASGYKAERDPQALREIGSLEERRITPEERMARSKGASSITASSFLADHWIYDASVELFFDADNDGYYRYMRVTFDVDSYYEKAWVFAALYLSSDGHVWELLHETEDFRVRGASPDDAYEVEVELVSGYPPGDYDLLIEIYDADTGVFVDELGPAQTSAFALLPLEDRSYDVPPPVVVVHERGGGGATSWPVLLLLAGAAGCASIRRRLVGGP